MQTPDKPSEDELIQAISACPGPRDGDPWWRRRRHMVMMEFGSRTHVDGTPTSAEAASYVRHQIELDRWLA